MIVTVAVMMVLSSIPAYAHHSTVGTQGVCIAPDPPSDKVLITSNPVLADTPFKDKRDGNANGWVCEIFIGNPSGKFKTIIRDDHI